MVGKVALGTGFFFKYYDFLCQDHSTTVPHVCFIHQSPTLQGNIVTLKQGKKENSLLASQPSTFLESYQLGRVTENS
jgi:hypothetical protein